MRLYFRKYGHWTLPSSTAQSSPLLATTPVVSQPPVGAHVLHSDKSLRLNLHTPTAHADHKVKFARRNPDDEVDKNNLW